MNILRVLLRDTLNPTDEGWYEEEYEPGRVAIEYLWTEGNYSCDCNRALFMARILGLDEPEEPPCGRDRYKIIAATLDGIPYPPVVDA